MALQFGGAPITTPEQAAKQRAVAAALIARSGTPASNWGQGLADVASSITGTVLNNRASDAETAGAERAGGLFGGLNSGSSVDDIAALLANPDAAWANGAQSGVAEALLGAQLKQNDPMYQAQLSNALNSGAGGDESFFGNPIPIQTPNGLVYGQIGNKGGFKPIDIGEGNQFLSPVQQINTGTEFTGVDKFGNRTGSVTPINNEEAEYDKAFGQGAGKASIDRVNALSNTLATADNMLSTIDGVLNDPTLDDATGIMAWTQLIPGTPAYSFGQRTLQLQGQAFLQAFNDLKGAGQITEVEGQKATQAIGRLSTSQSPEDYRSALNDLKGVINASKSRAAANAGRGMAPTAAPTASPTSGNKRTTSNGVEYSF